MERRRDDIAPAGKVDRQTTVMEWPISGAGDGCNSFLAALGVEDALIAYAPGPDEPRSLFVVGLKALGRQPEEVRRLVQAAERVWSPFFDQGMRLVDLPAGAGGLGGGVDEDHLLIGGWSSPLDPFAQAIVIQHVAAQGKLSMFLLRSKQLGRLEPDQLRLLGAALPLFQDAVLSFCLARRLEQRSALVRSMFDYMTLPTLLVDESLRPLMINRAALALLRRRDVVSRGVDGSITARMPRENRTLRAVVAAAAGVQHDNDDGMKAVRLTDRAGKWLLAMVVPARSCVDAEASAAAMIVIHEPQPSGAPACVLQALGLLPSEQRFLGMFLRANSLAEAAALSNLSQETARTYLKRVRSKMGAHRQMDLARLIYGLVPPIGTGGGELRLEGE